MNNDDPLTCQEVISISSISGPTRRLQIRNECLLMQPFTRTDFLTLRRFDGTLYNYASNVTVQTWEYPEKLQEFTDGHNYALGSGITPNHPVSCPKPIAEHNEVFKSMGIDISNSRTADFQEGTFNQDKSLFNGLNISNRKLLTSKYRLPFRDRSLENDESKNELNRPKEQFTYAPSSISFYSDKPSSELLSLPSPDETKLDPLSDNSNNNNPSHYSTEATFRRPISTSLEHMYKFYPYRNHLISYSWDSLQLGKRLGTPAFNRFRKKQQLLYRGNNVSDGTLSEYDTNTRTWATVNDTSTNHIDIQPLQMLQLVNTLRPATCHLPSTVTTNCNENGSNNNTVPLFPSYNIHQHDLQCDLNESIEEIISKSYVGKSCLKQDEETKEEIEHVPTEMMSTVEPWRLHVPRADIESLFKTMLAQDVDDGSLFRHEAMYLPPWEVIDYLRRLENDTTRLNEWESKLLQLTRDPIHS